MAGTSTNVLKILCFLTIINVTSEKLLGSVLTASDSVSGEASSLEKPNPVNTTDTNVERYDDITELLPIQFNPMDSWKRFSAKRYNSRPDKRDIDIVITKTKANAYYLPSILKSEDMYDKLKLTMPTDNKPIELPDLLTQHSNVEYQLKDEDDVKTSPRSVYGNWPSYYYTPYVTEHKRVQALIDKAKDKRHIEDEDSTRVIPIHEDLSHDIPSTNVPPNENPLSGNEPFFSFVLNDYFDERRADDRLTFKGLSDWDSNGVRLVADEYSTRNRRLENINTPLKYLPDPDPQSHDSRHSEIKALHSDSVTEKGISKGQEFTQQEKGDNSKVNDKANFSKQQKTTLGFKDFAEGFVNKNDDQDLRNESNFVVKKKQDNGEKTKGFHRIYRIDEYKEDKEFFNNSDNNAKLEEKGTLNTHVKGSKGMLGSSAAAALGSRLYDTNRAGNVERNKFNNYLTGQDMANTYEKDFRIYRDAAKQAALSNMDYSDQY